MKKCTFSLAVTVCVLSQQAGAAGFLEDSTAVLKARNFYINTDNRDSGTPAQRAANQSYQAEWGQGFQLVFTSGYTPGVVGFGVDALGMLGIKLDSSEGKHGNPTGANFGGIVFPSDGNHAVDEYSSLGLTAKVKISKTELKAGTLIPKLPVIISNDARMLPQTWEGTQITSGDIKGLSLIGGQIEEAKGRNSSDTTDLSITGANNSLTGKFSNKFIYFGGDYALNKDLTLQYYYGGLKDFYDQNYFGLIHNWALGPGVLKSDLRYFDSRDSGANGHDPDYYTAGYYGGNTVKGKVDNRLYSGMFSYAIAAHTFTGGYEVSSGDSDFPFLNQGDGSSSYAITGDLQLQKFGHAGEKTWLARYAYDFAAAGLPGLTAAVVYAKGSGVNTPTTSDASEWERDFTLAYVIQSGPAKGLGMMWKSGAARNEIPGVRNQDENRVILSYQLALF